MYREDWLNRFYEQRRPAGSGPQRQFTPQRRGSFKNGRFVPPDPPVGDDARAIAAAGIDAPTARALILGFANYPGGTARPLRAARLAPDRRQADRKTARRAGQRGLLRRRA